MLGLRPYTRRLDYNSLDDTARAALDWFQTSVPERTLHNWQNTAAKPLAEFLGTTQPVMNVLSVIMFGYAALIAFNTHRPTISPGFTLFTVLGDSGWVVASILLLILPLFSFSTDAKWAIGITAICVDIFATIQFLEWRKMR